jgi:hypothetical protein
MRIRSIKPEFWRSDDITELPLEDRLLFIGLWSYVDDNGVGKDKLASIAADLFAGDLENDPHETFARVSRGLQQLASAGRVTRYTVDGTAYLHVTNWERHQRVDRPNKPRYPVPTSDNAVPRETPAEPSRHSRETPSSGTGEQGNRGTGEQLSSSAPADAEETTPAPDVEAICTHLADRIEANGARRPTITKTWRKDARLLIHKDGYTTQQIHWIIDWCQTDPFWRTNILSMTKLREKFEQLKLKALNEARPATSKRQQEIDEWLGTTTILEVTQ